MDKAIAHILAEAGRLDFVVHNAGHMVLGPLEAFMTDVAAFSGVGMEPGTLYGALSRLERRGWIRPLAADERRRRG